MKLQRIRLYEYSLPMADELIIGEHILTNRTGYLICFEDGFGKAGWGEVSPLVNLHEETFESVRTELEGALLSMLTYEITMDKNFDFNLNQSGLAPSVEFGISMGLLNLIAEEQSNSVPRLLSSDPLEKVFVNGLITGENRGSIHRQIREMVTSGYRTIKMKVARGTLEQDIDNVLSAHGILGGKAELVLDANRLWDYEDAEKFCRAVNRTSPLYIEEPLSNPHRLRQFFRMTDMKYALDESVAELHPDLKKWPGAAALVLKPDTLGSVSETIRWIKSAHQHGLLAVISSSFNTGLALSFYAQIHSAFCSRNSYAGLDTWKWLENDVITNPFQAGGGDISISDCIKNANKINFEALNLISEFT